MIEESKLILFGAGVYAKKYKALLDYLHMDFDYFTDNDSLKWGTSLYGKTVISPSELHDFTKVQIIISNTHETEIREQLCYMGLSKCIIGLNDLYAMCGQHMKSDVQTQIHKLPFRSILIDMYEGIGWGGSELWAADLAVGLDQVGENVLLIGGTEQEPLEEKYEKLVVRISEKDTISHMVKLIETHLPCVFINNFAGCAFMAAIIVKKKYPELISIISVIHSDNKSLFDAHMMLQDYIDKVFGVSQRICEHMKKLYSFNSNQYYFKEQPITMNRKCKKEYKDITKPLVIGYAGRIVRQAKRADLLPAFIELLEESGIDYFFQIAGEGECLEKIETFIQKNDLSNKVQLLGRLPKSEMDSFWKRQDVFVNISEYEGTSLSMLEAMSYGCVPVVTDVSGAREFIVDGENGYICPVGAIEEIAECIKALAQNRRQLYEFGEKCATIIAEKCNPEKYIEYWINKIL